MLEGAGFPLRRHTRTESIICRVDESRRRRVGDGKLQTQAELLREML